MLSKCLNPACTAPFRYLHEGRVFNIELASVGPDNNPASKIEHFWLCARCAPALKVVVEDGVVRTRPLDAKPPDDAVSRSGGQRSEFGLQANNRPWR
jgi:hypothetical protein